MKKRTGLIKSFIVGIDLGGTNIRGGLFDLNCNILRQVEKKVNSSKDGANVLGKIKGLIYELINQSGVGKSKILGIGIGSPGVVDHQEGLVKYAANLINWENVPLAKIIEEEFDISTCVDHDIEMATLAELVRGAGKGKKDFVTVIIGTGIGMGLVVDGKICRLGRDKFGNFGHMIVSRKSKTFDYIEKYSSGLGILKNARKAILQGRGKGILSLASGDIKRVEAKTVFAAAKMGDRTAKRIISEAIETLSIGIVNVISLLGIEVFIIGGGIANAGKNLFIPLRKRVNNLISVLYQGGVKFNVKIVPAKLGNLSGLVGAAQSVWELQ